MQLNIRSISLCGWRRSPGWEEERRRRAKEQERSRRLEKGNSEESTEVVEKYKNIKSVVYL